MIQASHPVTSSRLAQLVRGLARVTAPLSRPLAGRRFFPIWAVVHHRGRRSGLEYAVPVAIRVTADGFIIPLPWGDRTQWLRNVLAEDGCVVKWRGVMHRVTAPRVVDFDEAAPAFHPIQRRSLRIAGVNQFVRLSRSAARR
jgi:deazaflavin-dependent oxidoreductase (nitroreductase family)